MRRTFSRRLIHESPVEISDGAGGLVLSWQLRGGLWCEVRMRSGQLKATEFGHTPRLAVRIVTHAIPAGHESCPAPGDRLTDGGRRYIVDAVHESGAGGRLMTILAREEAAA